jgi:hypothetical protein
MLLVASVAWADPCGMVPPIYVGQGPPIVRVGLQKTYVFYRDGIETFIIRPGFEGKVEDFGMLIPFPTPPAIRKIPDNVFAQIEAAIDPPEVVVDLRYYELQMRRNAKADGAFLSNRAEQALAVNTVRVLREEAVGMYEVAVLEAGSAAALKRWMDDHGYVYPNGMDKVCDEYVDLRWCFVAVKTRVGPKSAVDPQPGMRQVQPGLPAGSTFDGHVQAMGFRFPVKELVVPMRLSSFNEGELRNVVYLLTDGPRRIRSIPEEYVVRQVSGEQLYRNVTEPLPLRIIGGTEADIPQWQLQTLPQRRDPAPHNGVAKEIFAGDLLAAQQKRLSHPHEEAEKMLLRIGEHLSLRGPQIDELNLHALKTDRERVTQSALEGIKQMTMTVVDGDFPREVLAGQNLQFVEYRMPARRNNPQTYDAKLHGPAASAEGVRRVGVLSPKTAPASTSAWKAAGAVGMVFGSVGLVAGAVWCWPYHRRRTESRR